jgi:Dna[CI] antecedent, DciA
MRQLGQRQRERPDLILAVWPSLIGEKFASMARAQAFEEGILTVRVSNSVLLSLLVQNERGRLLGELRKQFPGTRIRDIRFRIG